MLKEFEQVVFTQEYRGYKVGTKAYFIKMATDSGFRVAEVAIIDNDFTSFLNEHGFDSIEDYIANKREHCIFGVSQWFMPFNISKPYIEGIASKHQILEMEARAHKDLQDAESRLELAMSLKKAF
ncbi:hypothetical protein LMH73_014465 [Vibrio splendidus]|nr:hypothetical protein [Vibrio splendidus]MCC4882502.1 hypothetical protein [Vibrio splendidus]